MTDQWRDRSPEETEEEEKKAFADLLLHAVTLARGAGLPTTDAHRFDFSLSSEEDTTYYDVNLNPSFADENGNPRSLVVDVDTQAQGERVLQFVVEAVWENGKPEVELEPRSFDESEEPLDKINLAYIIGNRLEVHFRREHSGSSQQVFTPIVSHQYKH